MGALHQGHISLIEIAKAQTDIVIASIFVNPTQFNNPDDLRKYPRPVTNDIAMLEEAGCHLLFFPAVEEMYKAHESWHFDIGYLEGLYEGAARPGHYQGVTQIVFKLFNAVKPDVAFFGQKDYQQFMVISKMVNDLALKVTLELCPIVREPDGLAMSSRNIHLKGLEREHALLLNKSLSHIKNNLGKKPLPELQKEAIELFNNIKDVALDYLEIADLHTLKPIHQQQLKEINSKKFIVLIAAVIGKTRLIDNVILP